MLRSAVKLEFYGQAKWWIVVLLVIKRQVERLKLVTEHDSSIIARKNLRRKKKC